jgi:ADP-ribosylglycohydrolase
MNSEYKDKLLGYFWAAFVADALGTPYEFMYGRLKWNPVIQQHGSLELGQVSDDSEMMLALFHSLHSRSQLVTSGAGGALGYNTDDAAWEYIQWAGSGCFDIGLNTRSLFLVPVHSGRGNTQQERKSSALRMYRANWQQIFGNKCSKHRWSQSNGCLMRCHALLLIMSGLDPIKFDTVVEQDCALSNPHPVCIESCKMFFRMCRELLAGTRAELTPEWATEPVLKQAITEAINIADQMTHTKRDVSRQRGWIAHAVYFMSIVYLDCTVYNNFSNLEDLLHFVIGKHLDSDTDTNAMIAAALYGLHHGYAKLYSNQVTRQNIETTRNCQAKRPSVYHPKRIDEYFMREPSGLRPSEAAYRSRRLL